MSRGLCNVVNREFKDCCTFRLDALHFWDLPHNETWQDIWMYPRTCYQAANLQHSFPNPYYIIAFILMRVALACLWLGVVSWSWAAWKGIPFHKWWAYLSHQGAFMELLFLWMTVVTTCAAWLNFRGCRLPRLPWFVRVTWLLGDTVPALAVMISLMFWAPILISGGNGLVVDNLAKVIHGGNVVVVCIDGLISRRPAYISHAFVPFCYAIFYVIFTYIYYKAGGTDAGGNPYIYIFLDWSGKSKVKLGGFGAMQLVMLLSFVGVPILYIICVYIRRCFRPDEVPRRPSSHMEFVQY